MLTKLTILIMLCSGQAKASKSNSIGAYSTHLHHKLYGNAFPIKLITGKVSLAAWRGTVR